MRIRPEDGGVQINSEAGPVELIPGSVSPKHLVKLPVRSIHWVLYPIAGPWPNLLSHL